MAPKRAPETALALVEQQVEPWRQEVWQRLWLSVQAQAWGTLAVVPAGAGAPRDFTLTVATTLARTGIMHLGIPIQVADGTRIQLSNVAQFLEELRRLREAGDLILIAVAASRESPVTKSLAQAADAALLCVMMEKMGWGEARETVRIIGHERFIGSVLFRPGDGSPSVAPPSR
jgi:non-ribosomal peptide synthetase component E (peptide arylation enzyme)